MQNTVNAHTVTRTIVIRSVTRILALTLGASWLSACATMSSPIEEAYHAGGQNFSFPGGYTRTIFSTNNF